MQRLKSLMQNAKKTSQSIKNTIKALPSNVL